MLVYLVFYLSNLRSLAGGEDMREIQDCPKLAFTAAFFSSRYHRRRRNPNPPKDR